MSTVLEQNQQFLIILVNGKNFIFDIIPADVEDAPWRAGISLKTDD